MTPTEIERISTVKWLYSFADSLRENGFEEMASGLEGAAIGVQRGDHVEFAARSELLRSNRQIQS